MSAHDSGHDGDGYADEAQRQHGGEGVGDGLEDAVTGRASRAEGLGRAPEAVLDVESEGEHGDDVDGVAVPGGEGVDDVLVRVPGLESAGVHGARRQVEDVPDDEQAEDDPAPAHRPGGIT